MDFSCDFSTTLQKEKRRRSMSYEVTFWVDKKFGWIVNMIYEMQEKLYPKVQTLSNNYNADNSTPSYAWISKFPFKIQRYYVSITLHFKSIYL